MHLFVPGGLALFAACVKKECLIRKALLVVDCVTPPSRFGASGVGQAVRPTTFSILFGTMYSIRFSSFWC